MVSRRSVLGFVTTGVTASVITWFAVGEDPPVSVDVNVNDETAETVSDATEVNTSLAGADADAGDTNTNSNWQPKTAAKQAHEIVNEERVSAGRDELDWREDVAAAAREYATKIAEADTLTHTLDGSQPSTRYSAAGIAAYSGENINQTWWQERMTTSPNIDYIDTADDLGQSIVTSWMTSNEHRENMLHWTNAAEGIGIAKNSADAVYSVQVFTR